MLVTGLSGFTGRYLEAELAARGLDVVDPGKRFDIADSALVDSVIAAERPDYVVHLAAISFVGHGDPSDFYRVNTIGTINILEALAKAAVPVRKVVIASSANIYGNTRQQSPLDETIPAAPINHYGCSKLSMEHLVRQWFNRMPIVITRPFNYTGRGQDEMFLVPKIVAHFIRRADVIELGNLDVSRDFSDVRDVAKAYAALLLSSVTSEIINLCSGRACSLRSLVERCVAITGHQIDVKVNPAYIRGDEVRTLVGSNDRLVAATGLANVRTISETLEWMLSNSDDIE